MECESLVDWIGEAILAALSFSIGAFLTYGIFREKMKTKAFEEAQRKAMAMLAEMYERERKRIEESIERDYKRKFEEWKKEFLSKLSDEEKREK
ncbi:MAG: hypothetical protein NDF55_07995 [archaeon GB-1867-005]|nr:hypothetical protein [Candidatus Culexmicrobium cathedralense]